ncbi:hypothetical protein DFH08DRAFT_800053 [Mycena albidolilacea]|uniref:Uncharacterized protein n=1 Tax=Mycena albidolilacea TaxID=1033008 RepID=A0AAD7ANX5_9AGAR|nr:hypothetical protein DFH08DRAFT_800053 [Mycena albidolilacea]
MGSKTRGNPRVYGYTEMARVGKYQLVPVPVSTKPTGRPGHPVPVSNPTGGMFGPEANEGKREVNQVSEGGNHVNPSHKHHRGPEPKPSQAGPYLRAWAWAWRNGSPSPPKPGPSPGFQAGPWTSLGTYEESISLSLNPVISMLEPSTEVATLEQAITRRWTGAGSGVDFSEM